MLTKEQAMLISNNLKIDLFSVYREYLQLNFLKHLYREKNSENLLFKGGTAIKFLLGSSRFSEDLDFTSLVSKKQAEKIVENAIVYLNTEQEVYFKKEKTLKDSLVYRVFENLPGYRFPLSVRADISLRENPLSSETSYIETIFPVGPLPFVVHLSPKEILSEKVQALMTSKLGRDIFDILYLVRKGVKFDLNLINKKMKFYGKKTTLSEILDVVKKMNNREIEKDLLRFLPVPERKIIPKLKQMLFQKLKEL